MFSNGIPQFDLDDPSFFDNNNGGDFNFDGFDFLDSSNVAGPSQTYPGVGVIGDLNSYPEYLIPPAAPKSLYSENELYPNKGYTSQLHRDITVPSWSHPNSLPSQLCSYPSLVSPSPVPTLSRGSPSLSPEPHTAPVTPIPHPYPQPQAITNQGGQGFGFPTMADNYSLPKTNYTPTYDPTYGELWSQFLDPSCFGLPSSNSTVSATAPEVPFPVPAASSSSPECTEPPAKETRRYNPLRGARRKVDPNADGWDRTLGRFRAHLDTLYCVNNGQPSEGLIEPEKALAEMSKFIKEDLKRSPLRNTKAGEGKRSRDVETYLESLLQAIRQVGPAPALFGGESVERGTIANVLSRVADELEAGLAVMNWQPALRQPSGVPPPGKGTNGARNERQKKRSQTEKERRENERRQIGRISRLFTVSRRPWSKKEVLGLAVLFLFYGPAVFPRDFIRVSDTVMGL